MTYLSPYTSEHTLMLLKSVRSLIMGLCIKITTSGRWYILVRITNEKLLVVVAIFRKDVFSGWLLFGFQWGFNNA